MGRTITSGGGESHSKLIRLASYHIIESFSDLQQIALCYENDHFRLDIKIQNPGFEGALGYTNVAFTFRPDILLRHPGTEWVRPSISDERAWTGIRDSPTIILEAETNPKNFYDNAVKCAAYDQIRKDRNIGRRAYAFVLVCWNDAQIPDDPSPFDEVWKFDRVTEELTILKG